MPDPFDPAPDEVPDFGDAPRIEWPDKYGRPPDDIIMVVGYVIPNDEWADELIARTVKLVEQPPDLTNKSLDARVDIAQSIIRDKFKMPGFQRGIGYDVDGSTERVYLFQITESSLEWWKFRPTIEQLLALNEFIGSEPYWFIRAA